jgi:hypothetical protein
MRSPERVKPKVKPPVIHLEIVTTVKCQSMYRRHQTHGSEEREKEQGNRLTEQGGKADYKQRQPRHRQKKQQNHDW